MHRLRISVLCVFLACRQHLFLSPSLTRGLPRLIIALCHIHPSHTPCSHRYGFKRNGEDVLVFYGTACLCILIPSGVITVDVHVSVKWHGQATGTLGRVYMKDPVGLVLPLPPVRDSAIPGASCRRIRARRAIFDSKACGILPQK